MKTKPGRRDFLIYYDGHRPVRCAKAKTNERFTKQVAAGPIFTDKDFLVVSLGVCRRKKKY